MGKESPLEGLSNELFNNILQHLTTMQDLTSLCITSHNIYYRTVPKLYHTWTYHGLTQSRKLLRNFLKTIIRKPDLAAHVKELDLRVWGSVPKLEDHVGIPWERKKKKKRVNEDESNKEEDDEHSSDGHDDSEVGEDSKSLGSDKSSSDHEEELNIGDSPGEPSEPIVTDHGFNIDEVLRTEADGLETNLNILADYHKVKNGNSEESSVPLLFDYLPNIKTLYLVQPEDCGINNQKVQEAAILQKLETVHLCSSLHIGIKGHREYQMELHEILPFLAIPNIHSLSTLTICTYDFNFNFNDASLPDLNPLKGTSNVKFLAWDKADIALADAIKAIAIPRALEGLRWLQQFWCTYPATCHGPFQHLIGKALLAHKKSLKTLDLDIRHHYCNGQRHPGNPQGTAEDDEYYKTRTFPNPEDRRMPQDAVLFGSLRDFLALKERSIDAASLCGHQRWVPVPVRMLDALPPHLEILKLRIPLRSPVRDQPAQFENKYFLNHLSDLLHRAKDQRPQLRELEILLIMDGCLPGTDSLVVGALESMIVQGHDRLRMSYTVLENGIRTLEPYFAEQTRIRNLGRDF